MNETIVFTASYVYLVSIAATVIYFFYIKKEVRLKFTLLSIFALPFSYLTGLLAGFLYYDARPFVVLHVMPLFPHIADNGFPSDHALLMGTLAAIVTAFSIRLGVFLWILAILVGVARVLANVHHSIDIIASLIIAATITAFVCFLLKKYKYHVDKYLQILLIALEKATSKAW